MNTALQHAVYSVPYMEAAESDDNAVVWGRTVDFPINTLSALHEAISLAPFEAEDASHTQALALVPHPTEADTFVLALAEKEDEQAHLHYILLSLEARDALKGDLSRIRKLAQVPIRAGTVTDAPLDPLTVPDPDPVIDRKANLQALRDLLPDGDMQTAFALLGALLHPDPLHISNYEATLEARLQLIQGLLCLLPVSARSRILFNTHTLTAQPNVQIQFDGEVPEGVSVYPIDWEHLQLSGTLLTANAYVAYLNNVWDEDIDAFVALLDAMASYAPILMAQEPSTEGLAAIARRNQGDRAVQSGIEISTQDLLSVIEGPIPPTDELYTAYIKRLFKHALDEHATDVAAEIVRRIDADPELETALQPLLTEALDQQPDAAYMMARVGLGQRNGTPEPEPTPEEEARRGKWLSRLHTAAENALAVAMETNDPAIISNWLRLISREPSAYNLIDILCQGITDALPQAHQDTELAQELLVLAVKRCDNLVPELIADETLMAQLPDELAATLQEPTSVGIEALADGARELFLLAVRRALSAEKPTLNSPIIRLLWQMHQGSHIILTEPYRPATLIRDIVAAGPSKLINGAIDTLLTLILNENEDALFRELAASLSRQAYLAGALARVLQKSNRDDDDKIMLISNLISSDHLTSQQAANSYVAMMEERPWEKEDEELVEQLARVLNQNPDISVEPGTLWHMIDLAEDTRSELMLRAAVRRLLDQLEEDAAALEGDTAKQFQRLRKAINWNPAARSNMMSWWRSYTGKLPLAQLQFLDQALEGSRSLEEMRAIVQTHISLRKVIGTRSLPEFAEQINTAFTVLGAIADGFDSNSRNLGVDTQTIRTVLADQTEELTPDEQQVLATNLKELAQLLTAMAANRSKPGLIRSDEAVDRGLASGEQAPQSALDVMKWLAGYMEGAQPSAEADD